MAPDQLDHRQAIKSHTELIAAAIKCNRAHVFGLQLMSDDSKNGDFKYDFLGVQDQLHFQISHNAYRNDAEGIRMRNNWGKIGRWQGEQIAYLLDLLNVEEANGRTFLDNTLIIWTNNMGACMDTHSYYNRCTLMFGGTDYFKSGRFFSYANARNSDGLPDGHLFVELLRSCGIQPSNYEVSGKAGFGFPMQSNANTTRSGSGKEYDLSDQAKRRGLPGIRRA